jgi:hypothetical protein
MGRSPREGVQLREFGAKRLGAKESGAETLGAKTLGAKEPSAGRGPTRGYGTAAVEPRTTSSGMNTNSLCGVGVPPISSSRAFTAAWLIAATG